MFDHLWVGIIYNYVNVVTCVFDRPQLSFYRDIPIPWCKDALHRSKSSFKLFRFKHFLWSVSVSNKNVWQSKYMSSNTSDWSIKYWMVFGLLHLCLKQVQMWKFDGLCSWCLTPLSTKFQLYLVKFEANLKEMWLCKPP